MSQPRTADYKPAQYRTAAFTSAYRTKLRNSIEFEQSRQYRTRHYKSSVAQGADASSIVEKTCLQHRREDDRKSYFATEHNITSQPFAQPMVIPTGEHITAKKETWRNSTLQITASCEGLEKPDYISDMQAIVENRPLENRTKHFKPSHEAVVNPVT